MTFRNDHEKMYDFLTMSKENFLGSYSYLTEEEYDATVRDRELHPITPREKLLYGIAGGLALSFGASRMHHVITSWVSPITGTPEMKLAMFNYLMDAERHAKLEAEERRSKETICPDWFVMLDGTCHAYRLQELTHE